MDLRRYINNLFYMSVFFVLCSSALISGCATTDEVGRMKWELNTLKSEVKKIKQRYQNIETKLPGQTKQIDKKLQELEDTQNVIAKTVSDLLINVQNLTSEFQVLTGRFEEARYFSEKSSTEVLESRDMLVKEMKEHKLALNELEKKLAQLAAEMSAAKEESKKIVEEEKDKKQKMLEAGEEARKAGVKDAYMSAYQTYKEGNAEEARNQFMSMLNSYPENEYSDNARFWIAESYYKEESYEDAILAYEELFKKNPGSDKIPGAMLKQGLAFYALKDKKTGKIVLEKLIEKFPDSEQARMASKKIKKTIPPKKNK